MSLLWCAGDKDVGEKGYGMGMSWCLDIISAVVACALVTRCAADGVMRWRQCINMQGWGTVYAIPCMVTRNRACFYARQRRRMQIRDFLWTLFNALCYSCLCCLVCQDDPIRVAEHTVWCCRKGFPACRESLSRAMIMPVWWCGRHRPTCRECAWRLPYWYKRMYEWVRMVLRERFYTGFVFCFAIFCCQNFLPWKCIFMHSAIAGCVAGA